MLGTSRAAPKFYHVKIPAIYFAALALPGAFASAQTLESIKVGDVTYRNPTIRQEFPRSILINHDEGMAFVERENLLPGDLAKLSALPETEAPVAAAEEKKEAETPPDTSSVTEQETVDAQEAEASEAAADGTTATAAGEGETSTAEDAAPSPEPAPESSAQE